TVADEDVRARQLRDRLDAALASGVAVSPLWVGAVAAYFPLYKLAAGQALLARTWPAPITTLLVQQIREPQEQVALRASIRQLTPIDGGISQAVQTQYEVNPY